MKKVIILAVLFIIITYGTCWADEAEEVAEGLEKARVMQEKGHKDAVITAFLTLRQKYPENTRVIREFADFMVEVRDYGFALRLYDELLKINPGDLLTRKLKIDLFLSLDLTDEALDDCKQYLKYDPDAIDILKTMEEVYMKDKRVREALLVTEQILAIEPENEAYRQKLIQYYYLDNQYKKGAAKLDQWGTEGFPPYLVGTTYLEAERYDRAIEIFDEMYEQEPTEENSELLERAKMAKIHRNMQDSPGNYGSYFQTVSSMHRQFPGDQRANEVFDYMKDNIAGVYPSYSFGFGESGGVRFNRNVARVYYPVLSTGTELMVTGNRTKVWNNVNTAYYNQVSLDVNQPLGKLFYAGAGVGAGDPGTTYQGRIGYRGEKVEAFVTAEKDYQLQSPEALQREISYTSLNYYASWEVVDRIELFGRYADIDYSDNNHGQYYEYGVNSRIWENGRNSFIDASLYRSHEDFNFVTPFYNSPNNLKTIQGSLEWSYYLDRDSLLKLGYGHSWDNNSNNFSSYSGYLDRRFSENVFVYGEYLGGISRLGRIGPGEARNDNDYEMNIGIKVRF